MFLAIKNTIIYKFPNPAGHRPMAMIPLDKLYLRYQTRHQIIRKIRQIRDPAFHTPDFHARTFQFLHHMTFKIARRQRSHQPCKVIQQHIVHIFQHSKHLRQSFTVFVRFKIGTVHPAFIGFIYSSQCQCFGRIGIRLTGDVKFPSRCSLWCYIAICWAQLLFSPVPFVIF